MSDQSGSDFTDPWFPSNLRTGATPLMTFSSVHWKHVECEKSRDDNVRIQAKKNHDLRAYLRRLLSHIYLRKKCEERGITVMLENV